MMGPVLAFIILFISLFFATELTRRYKYANIVFFIIVPVLLLPLWISNRSLDVFKWAKVYSVIAGALVITYLRYQKKAKISKYFYPLITLILGINILEASAVAIFEGNLASVLNGIFGLLLIILMGESKSMSTSKKQKDFLYFGLNWQWIMGYTLWNISFIYLHYSHATIKHLAVLGVPLLYNYLKQGSWLEARAYTLGLYLLSLFTFGDFFIFHDMIKYNSLFAPLLSILGISFFLMMELASINDNKYKYWWQD